jgi:hypothetical protein
MNLVYFGDGPLYRKTQTYPDPAPRLIVTMRRKDLPIMINYDGHYDPFYDYEEIFYERVGYLYKVKK